MQCSHPMYKSARTAYHNKFEKRGNARLLAAVITALAVASLGACDMPHTDNGAEEESGALRLTIHSGDSLGALTLLPDKDMEPAEYRISGTGPGDAGFETSTSGGTQEFRDLSRGEWEIEVSAFNADEEEIGYGRQTVEINNGETAEVGITVRALSGTGSLSLSVVWPGGEVGAAEVVATLTDSGGESQSLSFENTAEGAAEYSGSEIAAGYYTLVLQLKDGEHVVAGAVDSVRIVQDGLTEGEFNFEDLNHPTGEIEIIVVPEMDDPLEVEISGAGETLAYGESMTVEAVVENADGAILVYEWYLNGAPVGSESSLTFGYNLSEGSYRLDLVVFAEDGQRSGSAAHNLTVE